MRLDIDELDEHHLVGIDQNGHLCSCGVRSGRWYEHMAAVILTVFKAPPVRVAVGPVHQDLNLDNDLATRQILLNPSAQAIRTLLIANGPGQRTAIELFLRVVGLDSYLDQALNRIRVKDIARPRHSSRRQSAAMAS